MEIIMNNALDTTVVLNSGFGIIKNVSVSMGGGTVSMGGGMESSGDMTGEVGMPEANGGGTLLSSWGFVGGITAATLVVSVVLGVLLAKKRIKKGFDLYEN